MEHHEEKKRKCRDQKKRKQNQFRKCIEDFPEHDDVYWNHRNLRCHKDQVEPPQEDASDSNLPLPPRRASTVVEEYKHHKDNSCDVEHPFHIVLRLKQVGFNVAIKPNHFSDQVINCENNDTSSTHVSNNVSWLWTCRDRATVNPFPAIHLTCVEQPSFNDCLTTLLSIYQYLVSPVGIYFQRSSMNYSEPGRGQKGCKKGMWHHK